MADLEDLIQFITLYCNTITIYRHDLLTFIYLPLFVSYHLTKRFLVLVLSAPFSVEGHTLLSSMYRVYAGYYMYVSFRWSWQYNT